MNAHSLTLTSAQSVRLEAALARHEPLYDSSERMLHVPIPANVSYHTTMRNCHVHPTYNSLVYAVALLDAGGQTRLQRAVDILDRVTALQDSDPASRTYGIWSWYMDEPLEKMAPPDWNFADFCGTQLLEAILIHEGRLPRALVRRMDQAILHAARSIERRNVGPDYTNIAIMGSFVTLMAAERHQLSDLKAYATSRFHHFFDYTQKQGAFNEYNSPTYTFIALNELGRIRRYVQDMEMRRIADNLYRKEWEEIASHFHFPTQQWAGPHSRSYSTLLTPNLIGFLHRATRGRVQSVRNLDETDLDEQRLVHECPVDLLPAFEKLKKAHSVRQIVYRGKTDIVGTTYLDPRFALGTINRGDLWNQRRALVAYWGTAEKPCYLHLRFLHDGWDFSAAQFCSVQRKGEILAGIAFAHDAGDTHICLDMIRDGTIRAKDLRLRFEFGNLPSEVRLAPPAEGESSTVIDCGDIQIGLSVPHALWNGQSGHWKIGGEGNRRWLDLIFYQGVERSFILPEQQTTSIALALQMSPVYVEDSFPTLHAEEKSDTLQMDWEGLSLELPLRSHTTAILAERTHCTVLDPLCSKL